MSFFTENSIGIPKSVLKEKQHLVERGGGEEKKHNNAHTREVGIIEIISGGTIS